MVWIRRKAQAASEYMLVMSIALTAIIAAVLAATRQFIKPRIQGSVNHVTQEMEKAVKQIKY